MPTPTPTPTPTPASSAIRRIGGADPVDGEHPSRRGQERRLVPLGVGALGPNRAPAVGIATCHGYPFSDADAQRIRSVSPVTLPAADRPVDLQVRILGPAEGRALPTILLSHGHGPSNYVSSLHGYPTRPARSATAAGGPGHRSKVE